MKKNLSGSERAIVVELFIHAVKYFLRKLSKKHGKDREPKDREPKEGKQDAT